MMVMMIIRIVSWGESWVYLIKQRSYPVFFVGDTMADSRRGGNGGR